MPTRVSRKGSGSETRVMFPSAEPRAKKRVMNGKAEV